MNNIIQILIIIGSFGMMAMGGLIAGLGGLDALTAHNKTIMQQIGSLIVILIGVCIFGFGLVALAICSKRTEAEKLEAERRRAKY